MKFKVTMVVKQPNQPIDTDWTDNIRQGFEELVKDQTTLDLESIEVVTWD